MKKIAILIAGVTLVLTASTPLMSALIRSDFDDETYDEITETEVSDHDGYQKIENVAQYKDANWNNVVCSVSNISLSEAFDIADGNPVITYFFYTKGYKMVLETKDGGYRLFRHGDTVFFTGSPWWGSAPGLADGYVKL
ncbi:MAG: hypothetical protein HN411_00760 [Waddliaceae bacterium]|jgi:hypothetical protein|nr:hypothetical protein [Waddliaceae bacterium]MBT3579527.1 hypothetical protein [Waddliaceae bacterium]MBT4444555.1 hypothetical protein [Waddliaceae bacterium]MBT6928640.1 hypothetical protein [Waddliaceae bacterium]MBT7265178.1 hypothetical protein [Waddliaceae bacterium]